MSQCSQTINVYAVSNSSNKSSVTPLHRNFGLILKLHFLLSFTFQLIKNNNRCLVDTKSQILSCFINSKRLIISILFIQELLLKLRNHRRGKSRCKVVTSLPSKNNVFANFKTKKCSRPFSASTTAQNQASSQDLPKM